MEKWAGLGAGLNNILSWIRQSKLSAGLDAGVGLSKNRWAESFCPAWLTLTWASLLIHSAAFSRSRLPFLAKRLLLVQGGWAEGCGCCCGDAHSYTVAVPGIKDQGPCVSLAFVFMPPSSPGFSPTWNSFFVSPRSSCFLDNLFLGTLPFCLFTEPQVPGCLCLDSLCAEAQSVMSFLIWGYVSCLFLWVGEFRTCCFYVEVIKICSQPILVASSK